jgi:hypothetical protein
MFVILERTKYYVIFYNFEGSLRVVLFFMYVIINVFLANFRIMMTNKIQCQLDKGFLWEKNEKIAILKQ